MTDVDEIVQEFSDDLEAAVRVVLVKNDVEKNADLVKSIEFKEQNGVFVMLANDYYTYVSTGRKPRARKVPIMDLVQWIKDKRIRPRAGQTINQLAFAIQTSIYKSGIKGKTYLTEVEDVVADVSEVKVADGLEDALLEGIDKTFK